MFIKLSNAYSRKREQKEIVKINVVVFCAFLHGVTCVSEQPNACALAYTKKSW
jgi:hypothetical protein